MNLKLTVVSFLPPLSSSLAFAADLPTCVVADGEMTSRDFSLSF